MKFLLRPNILILLMIVLTITSCTKKDPEETGEATSSKGIEVELISPVKKKLTEYVKLNASTSFLNQEIVRATFAGFIVKSYKNPGDHIKQGELLFLMRTKESSATDSISYGAGQFTGLVKIYSRTSGVLSELSFPAGNYVTEGDKLSVIVEPQSVKIMLNVPFQYARFIQPSGRYTFYLSDGREAQARVVKKIPSIDPANQTQTFILEPITQMELPANLNLIVRIPVKTASDAIALPKTSIVSNETQTEFWVMKAVSDTMAVKADVKKGIETDSLVEIISPALNLSDRFIKDGAYGLPDTAKIIIKK